MVGIVEGLEPAVDGAVQVDPPRDGRADHDTTDVRAMACRVVGTASDHGKH
jgi:hypothetical protein